MVRLGDYFDKKTMIILILLGLFVVSRVGWFYASSEEDNLEDNVEECSFENVYNWSELFHGYEAYLDKEISYSEVQGTSMEPTFEKNDILLWVKVDISNLKEGDIIIYEHPTRGDELIAHRIIDVLGGNKFETKGDNRKKSDAKTNVSAYYVTKEDYKGLVIGVIYS